MHDGVWDKSAKGSHEVRGRTLGIVGYGNIGTQLSNLAEALGLRVIFFDTADRLAHGNAQRMQHPRRAARRRPTSSASTSTAGPATPGFFGAEQFAKMKPRSLFINAARGMVVDNESLREHILSGHIAGAALDVFPVEPKAQGDEFESVAARPRQRDPHPARRRLDPGGAGGDRLLRGRQARRLRARGPHRAVGQPARRAGARSSTPGHRVGYLHHQRARRARRRQPASLADSGDNITGQYLSTRGEQGYVVTDTLDPLAGRRARRSSPSPSTPSGCGPGTPDPTVDSDDMISRMPRCGCGGEAAVPARRRPGRRRARASGSTTGPGRAGSSPDSPIARVHGDASMFVGGIRALLLQTLHPAAMRGGRRALRLPRRHVGPAGPHQPLPRGHHLRPRRATPSRPSTRSRAIHERVVGTHGRRHAVRRLRPAPARLGARRRGRQLPARPHRLRHGSR